MLDNLFKQKEAHEKQVRVFTWKSRAEGGIQDEWIERDTLPLDAMDWTICGIKLPLIGYKPGIETPFSIKFPSIVNVSPRTVYEIVDAKPRQELDACNKSVWQKVQQFIPIIVIGLGFLAMVILF